MAESETMAAANGMAEFASLRHNWLEFLLDPVMSELYKSVRFNPDTPKHKYMFDLYSIS